MIKQIIAFTILYIATSSMAYDFLPNAKLTPGKSASINIPEVCTKDYPLKSRNVTQSTKKKVYERYSVNVDKCRDGCKIDHLIPLSIGGSNDITNLWPHEYGAEWTVYEKTRLEVKLRTEVCSLRLPIQTAQQCIATNWTQCYNQFYPNQHKGKK
jgi:hypothetical protein